MLTSSIGNDMKHIKEYQYMSCHFSIRMEQLEKYETTRGNHQLLYFYEVKRCLRYESNVMHDILRYTFVPTVDIYLILLIKIYFNFNI